MASIIGNLEVVKAIVEKLKTLKGSGEFIKKEVNGKTAINVAETNNHSQIVSYLTGEATKTLEPENDRKEKEQEKEKANELAHAQARINELEAQLESIKQTQPTAAANTPIDSQLTKLTEELAKTKLALEKQQQQAKTQSEKVCLPQVPTISVSIPRGPITNPYYGTDYIGEEKEGDGKIGKFVYNPNGVSNSNTKQFEKGMYFNSTSKTFRDTEIAGGKTKTPTVNPAANPVTTANPALAPAPAPATAPAPAPATAPAPANKPTEKSLIKKKDEQEYEQGNKSAKNKLIDKELQGVFNDKLKNRRYKRVLRSGLLTGKIEIDSFKKWLSDNKITSALGEDEIKKINEIIDRKPGNEIAKPTVDFEKFKKIMHLISEFEEQSPDIKTKLEDVAKKLAEPVVEVDNGLIELRDIIASIVAAVTSKIPVKK